MKESCINCLNRDLPYHGFVACYALAGWAVAIAAGVPHKFVPFTYTWMLIGGLLPPVALLLAGLSVWSLKSPTPLITMRASISRMLIGAQAVAGLLLFLTMLVCMGVFLSLKTMLADIVPFYADPYLADLDVLFHGTDPWRYAEAVFPHQLTPVLEIIYFGVWGLLVTASMLAVLLMPKLRAVRSQYLWTVLVTWPLLGNVIAGIFMSAGPVFYDRVTAGGDPRFQELTTFLAQASVGQEWARDFLWKNHLSGEVGAGVAISAFPSMHLAVATQFVLLARHVGRGWMWCAATMCAAILFGSIYLGWHYAVDGYFSIIATIVVWRLIGSATTARTGDVQRGESFRPTATV